MPGETFKAPTGTRDVLAPESRRWQALRSTFADLAGRSGYELLETPVFEELGVFLRVGEGTDIVRKEMYDFEDKGGRRLVLRPEGTAAVCRAFVQHHPPTPWKVWYAAPAFRYERPQAGRYRQHTQLGIEVIGSEDPDVDVEVLWLGDAYLRSLGLKRVLLVLNSIGDHVCRPPYLDLLRDYLTDRHDQLCDEHRPRVAENPLRILDCKRKACREATQLAPRTVDHLCESCHDHFQRVLEGLSSLGIDYAIDHRLVRGLDYYTRTTFEFQAAALDNAQSTICAGGRYNGLVESLGGPPTPGIGFGSGVERVLLACDAEGVFPAAGRPVDVFVLDTVGGDAARDLTALLRREGIGADRAFDARSMKSQMKAADRSGARYAAIVGDEERSTGTVTLRSLREEGEQERVPREKLADHLRGLL
jgi:histidyl-tRNA synthetase